MNVLVVAAVARNRVIGHKGRVPWRIEADLRRFREMTMGHSVIMGHRTWSSIGRPLDGRFSIVLSRDPGFAPGGATVARSLDEALRIAGAQGTGIAVVIGGGEVFEAMLPLADVMELTEIEHDVEGDVRFPDFDAADWPIDSRTEHTTPEGLRYAFVRRVRRHR